MVSVSLSRFYWLRQLRRSQRSLDTESAATLDHALVASRLDYCNAVLAGAPKVTTDKLQRVLMPQLVWSAVQTEVWPWFVAVPAHRATLARYTRASRLQAERHDARPNSSVPDGLPSGLPRRITARTSKFDLPTDDYRSFHPYVAGQAPPPTFMFASYRAYSALEFVEVYSILFGDFFWTKIFLLDIATLAERSKSTASKSSRTPVKLCPCIIFLSNWLLIHDGTAWQKYRCLRICLVSVQFCIGQHTCKILCVEFDYYNDTLTT